MLVFIDIPRGEHIYIYVLCGEYTMKKQVTAINQDGNAGDFFHHGTCTTPVDATAEITKYHPFPFARTLADRMSNLHTNSTLQGAGRVTECPMIRFKEVGK